MSNPLREPTSPDAEELDEVSTFPEVTRGTARIAALHLVEPVSVLLLVGERRVSFLADDALLERALTLRHLEHQFTALQVPGQPPRLLRLDPLPEGRTSPSATAAATFVANRWAETLRRLAAGPT